MSPPRFSIFALALLFGLSLAEDPAISYVYELSYLTASPLGVPQQVFRLDLIRSSFLNT